MTARQRRAHVVIWVILGLLLGAGIATSLSGRPSHLPSVSIDRARP